MSVRQWLLAPIACLLTLPVAAPGMGARSYHIAVIPPGYTSPFHVAVKDGAAAEARAFGWAIDTASAASETDFNQQANIVDDEVAKHVDIISVDPIGPVALIGAIRRANRAHVPILVHNLISAIGQGVDVTEYIGYNQWNGAKAMGAYACKLLHGHGEVYILDGVIEVDTHLRTGGFKDGLRACMGPGGVTIDGEQTANWLRTQAQSVATAALTKYPHINLFFGDSDEMDIGAAIAARRLNKNVYTIGIDGNPVTLDLIARGQVTATLGVYPTMMGKTIVDQMRKILRGEKVPLVLETPATVVTRENVAAYRAGRTWTAPVPGRLEPET